MNKIILGVAFAIALMGPAYAAGRFGFVSPSQPIVIAGQINKDGRVVKGMGFTSRLVQPGEYTIKFNPGVLPGCAAMVVTPLSGGGAPTGVVAAAVQHDVCSVLFRVDLTEPPDVERPSASFQFVVVQE